jgi:hypothetical protein
MRDGGDASASASQNAKVGQKTETGEPDPDAKPATEVVRKEAAVRGDRSGTGGVKKASSVVAKERRAAKLTNGC